MDSNSVIMFRGVEMSEALRLLHAYFREEVSQAIDQTAKVNELLSKPLENLLVPSLYDKKTKRRLRSKPYCVDCRFHRPITRDNDKFEHHKCNFNLDPVTKVPLPCENFNRGWCPDFEPKE